MGLSFAPEVPTCTGMIKQFDPNSWKMLAERYRAKAETYRRKAAITSHAAMKAAYEKTADGFDKMAEEIMAPKAAGG